MKSKKVTKPKKVRQAGNGTKPNVGRSVAKAKNIIADIYSLMGKHKDADWELNKATDAMYKFISEVEGS